MLVKSELALLERLAKPRNQRWRDARSRKKSRGGGSAEGAATLAASINYPLRGAVTWKSIVGTNVAADALSNLASPGVVGGAMIILGEDYGEGASVIQERPAALAPQTAP